MGFVARAAAGVALCAAVVAPVARAQSAALPTLPALTGRGATPAAREARAAQRRYELARRRLLDPYAGEAPGRCDVTIGRLCYWDNNGDARPLIERPALRRARQLLLDDLARVATADPADDWIAGQRVRYLVEAARAAADSASTRDPVGLRSPVGGRGAPPLDATAPSSVAARWAAADSAAAACRGTPWWCQTLVGLAAHSAGRHAAAAAAFDRARTLLPDAAARCAWDDLSPWLPGRAQGAYRRLPCGSAERTRYEARAWRLAAPFWTLAANDLRAELAARRVLVRLYATGSENPQALIWGEDLSASDVRYGVPTAWSVRDPVGLNGQPTIVGHEPTPSFDFWPEGRTLAPAALLADAPRLPDADAWELRRPDAQTRYAPSYAGAGVYALPHQLVRFRRGDTLVVVGTYDARERGDSVPPGTGTGPVRAGFVLDDLRTAPHDTASPVPAPVLRDGAPREGALVVRVLAPAPAAPTARDTAPATGHWLAALEVFDTAAVRFAQGATRRGRAGRVRAPIAPLGPNTRLSDLLVVRPGLAAAGAPTLAMAVDSAAGAVEARVGRPLGLFWEQYAGGTSDTSRAAADTVVITATRLESSWRERLGALVGRPAGPSVVRVRYPVPAAGGARVVGRAVTLTWPDVPAGLYRLEVAVPGPVGTVLGTSAVVVRVSR